MGYARSILMRMFGHPRGALGRLGGVIMARTNAKAAMEVVDLLDIRPSDKVLEVGFGPGVGIQLLAERASAGHVAGIDLSGEMREQAVARNAAAVRGGRVDLRRGSVEALPFPDAMFDHAVAINSMQVWPDAVLGLREVRRVLKPGGHVALGFTVHSGQAESGVAEVLAAVGFRNARILERNQLFCAVASK
jgi:ubiquinone/menaquinone biosynthesis C-methylase UbiE